MLTRVGRLGVDHCGAVAPVFAPCSPRPLSPSPKRHPTADPARHRHPLVGWWRDGQEGKMEATVCCEFLALHALSFIPGDEAAAAIDNQLSSSSSSSSLSSSSSSSSLSLSSS